MSETENVYTIPYEEVSIANIEGMDSNVVFASKDATYSNTTTYKDLKSVIKQIFKSTNRIGINSIMYSGNGDGETLTGTLNLSFYSVTGTGKEYTAPKITAYPAGTDDIFNSNQTISKESDNEEETEEDGNEEK
jgi:hypothetical protein